MWLLVFVFLVSWQAHVSIACKQSCFWLALGGACALQYHSTLRRRVAQKRTPKPTVPSYCSWCWNWFEHWAATTSSLLLSVSLVMSFFLRFSLLLFSSFQPADGTKKKWLSVSSSGRVKSLNLKTYSSFLALSLNVPFVLQKVFQEHVQSRDFFLNVPCSIFALLQSAEECFWLGCCLGCGIQASSVPFLVNCWWAQIGCLVHRPLLLLKDLTPCGRNLRVWSRTG